jgi:hypothetical protein
MTLCPDHHQGQQAVEQQVGQLTITFNQGHRVHGCGGSIASFLPYKNATKIFLPILHFKKIFYTSKY